MTALTPISDKLDPLIRRLASDQAGERLACIAAIERQLGKAGLTFHDLADRLTSAPETPAQNNEVPIVTNYSAAVEWLLATDAGDLTARELDFLESMRGILRKWPPRRKQAKWIGDLVAKLGGQFNG